MGEPGTKEVLTLADLEAAGGIHTGRKHILTLLVENKPGVLARIAGLFSRRGFNIETLAVGPTDDDSLSRITLTLDGALHPIDQVTKQLHKLVNVIKIRDLEPKETVARELAACQRDSADRGGPGPIGDGAGCPPARRPLLLLRAAGPRPVRHRGARGGGRGGGGGAGSVLCGGREVPPAHARGGLRRARA